MEHKQELGHKDKIHEVEMHTSSHDYHINPPLTPNSTSSFPQKKSPSDVLVGAGKNATMEDEQEVSFFHDFIAGGVAGSASVVVGHPMDTLKVRMQTTKGNPSIASLAIGSKYGGPATLFRGMAAPLSAACAVNALIFSSYGWSSRLYEHYSPANCDQNLKAFTCGSFAGLVQALVICPMEHVKCRLQIQETAGSTSHPLRTTLRTILTSGSSSANIPALYRGWFITCWREIPAFGAYFSLYDIFKDRIQDYLEPRSNESNEPVVAGMGITERRSPQTLLINTQVEQTTISTSAGMSATTSATNSNDNEDKTHTWLASAIAGGLTGALTWAIVYPFDVIKTQIQTAPVNTPQHERKIVVVTEKIIKQHGWKHLFRGLTVTCLRAFPVNGIIFPVYEYTLLLVCAWES